MYKIKAIAPTAYQYNALKHFHLDIKKVGDGSFVGERKFESKEKAEEYLIAIGYIYFDFDDGDENEANEMRTQIKKCGILQIDGVPARIEEIFEEQ